MTQEIICSGALFYSLKTKRFLLLHRTQSKQKHVWGLVGGTNGKDELPWLALEREIQEEIGSIPTITKTIPLETFISTDEKFSFHTYLVIIQEEFIPELNYEHDGYAWVSFGRWPKPLHMGLRNTLQSKTNQTKFETVFNLIDYLGQENNEGN
jgi:8-oxo-dGTP pyrophosphatase MutT (NUDIX family)|tara:strand:- start:112 stop:570 length:459 start_codon:yes stop_codon:yes gene_type:complete